MLPWIGPGPHNRHFDHQVVETTRLQPRQHAHLRPALDLKHAHRVRAADHVVHARVSGRDTGQRQCAAGVPLDQVKTSVNGREHAQRQAIDLQHSQRIEVVLVPLDHGPVRHGGIFDRHQLAQRALRDHHAAHMLGQVARKADQFIDQINQPAPRLRLGIETHLPTTFRQLRILRVTVHLLGQRVDAIERQAERFTDVANRGAGTIRDHHAGHARPLAPVFAVQILQHFLTPLVLEIDIDVRRFVAFPTDKPLEQDVQSIGIDRRDAQAEADGRIGGRTAPLAQDVAAAGKTHQVPDGEEVGFVTQFFDQRQLVLDQAADFVRDAAGVTLVGALPGELLQVVERCLAGRGQFFRVFITQFIERKLAARGDFQGAAQRGGHAGKRRAKFLPRVQMTLGVRLQPIPGFGHRHPVTNGGQDIMQGQATANVIEHVAGSHQRNAAAA